MAKRDDKAQAYAMRVWEGQSRSLPRAERIDRVHKALEGQGLSVGGVTLPDAPEVDETARPGTPTVEPEPAPLSLFDRSELWYAVDRMNERRYNGRELDWNHWSKMSTLSAHQFSRLAAGLSPHEFQDLNAFHPVSTDFSRARDIEELAEADRLVRLTPVKWIQWVQEKGVRVSARMLKAYAHLLDQQAQHGAEKAEELLPVGVGERGPTLNPIDPGTSKPKGDGAARKRKDAMHGLVVRAISEADEPDDAHSVMRALVRIAKEEKCHPLTGEIVAGAVQWKNRNGDNCLLDIKLLRERIRSLGKTKPAQNKAG